MCQVWTIAKCFLVRKVIQIIALVDVVLTQIAIYMLFNVSAAVNVLDLDVAGFFFAELQ